MIALLRLELVYLLRRMGGRAFLGVALGVGLFVSMPVVSVSLVGPERSFPAMFLGRSALFALAVFVSILPLFGIAASMAPLEAMVWSLPVTRRRAMAAHILFWATAWWLLALPVFLALIHHSEFSAEWAVTSLAFTAGLATVAASAILMLASAASRQVRSGAGGELVSTFVRTIGLAGVAAVFSFLMIIKPLDSPLAGFTLGALLSCCLGLLFLASAKREMTGQSTSPAPAPRRVEGVVLETLPQRSPDVLLTGVTLAGTLRRGLLRDPLFLLWTAMLVLIPLLLQGGGLGRGLWFLAQFIVFTGLGAVFQRSLTPARPFLPLPIPRERLFRAAMRLPDQVALLSLVLLVVGGTFPLWGIGFYKESSGGVRLWVESPRASLQDYDSWERSRSVNAPVASDTPALVAGKLGRILEAQFGLRPDPAELLELVGTAGEASGPGFPSKTSDAWSGAIVRVGRAFEWRIRGVLFLRGFFSTLLVATLVLFTLRGLVASRRWQGVWRWTLLGPIVAAWFLQAAWMRTGYDGGLPGPTLMAIDRFLRSQGFVLLSALLAGLWLLWRSCERAFARMEVTDFPGEKAST